MLLDVLGVMLSENDILQRLERRVCKTLSYSIPVDPKTHRFKGSTL